MPLLMITSYYSKQRTVTSMRKNKSFTKRSLTILFLPLLLISSATVAYGALQDFVNVELSLTTMHKPNISLKSTLLNTQDNIIAVFINKTTKIVEDTDPSAVQLQINLTNIDTPLIDRIMLNVTLPNDWNWAGQLFAQKSLNYYINEIDLTYDNITRTLTIVIPSIKEAVGSPLNYKESVLFNLDIEYSLKGEVFPLEYVDVPPTYSIAATAVAFTGEWASLPKDITTTFTTYVYEK